MRDIPHATLAAAAPDNSLGAAVKRRVLTRRQGEVRIRRQEEHVLHRAGSRIHYWLGGASGGPLVALSHGASMDHCMFDSQLDALTQAGYRTLTWDVRGHGLSKPLGDEPVTIADMAADLLAILDEVDERGPVCHLGQSLGGYIAQRIVFDCPERVAALVVIDATCATLPIARWERWALASSPTWFRLWPENHLRRIIARSTAATPEVQEYALEANRQLTKREFVAVWRAVAAAIHPEPGYRIEQPLLLTHGDRDRTGNVAEVSPTWAARDPRCRYEVIP